MTDLLQLQRQSFPEHNFYSIFFSRLSRVKNVLGLRHTPAKWKHDLFFMTRFQIPQKSTAVFALTLDPNA